MDMPPEIVAQLLDSGPKRSSFRFLFVACELIHNAEWTGQNFIVWPMMMETFVVMFSGKFVYVSRKLMAIEPMTAVNLLDWLIFVKIYLNVVAMWNNRKNDIWIIHIQ